MKKLIVIALMLSLMCGCGKKNNEVLVLPQTESSNTVSDNGSNTSLDASNNIVEVLGYSYNLSELEEDKDIYIEISGLTEIPKLQLVSPNSTKYSVNDIAAYKIEDDKAYLFIQNASHGTWKLESSMPLNETNVVYGDWDNNCVITRCSYTYENGYITGGAYLYSKTGSPVVAELYVIVTDEKGTIIEMDEIANEEINTNTEVTFSAEYDLKENSQLLLEILSQDRTVNEDVEYIPIK